MNFLKMITSIEIIYIICKVADTKSTLGLKTYIAL